jgi:hypothetical protein
MVEKAFQHVTVINPAPRKPPSPALMLRWLFQGSMIQSAISLPVVDFMHEAESFLVFCVQRVLDYKQGKGDH